MMPDYTAYIEFTKLSSLSTRHCHCFAIVIFKHEYSRIDINSTVNPLVLNRDRYPLTVKAAVYIVYDR